MTIGKLLALGAWVAIVWCLAVVVHLLREAWWIMQNGYQDPPPCGRWWCPQTWALRGAIRRAANRIQRRDS